MIKRMPADDNSAKPSVETSLKMSVVKSWQELLGKNSERFTKKNDQEGPTVLEHEGQVLKLRSPAQVISVNEAWSTLLLMHEATKGAPLMKATNPAPRQGFLPREWDQDAGDTDGLRKRSITADRTSELETAMKAAIENMPDGCHDFVVLKTVSSDLPKDTFAKQTIRWINHDKNPNTIGHGSMFTLGEREGVTSDDVTSREIQVLYAGQFTVGGNKLLHWDNRSGHFLPTTASAQAAPFPIGSFHSQHVESFAEAKRELNGILLKGLTNDIFPINSFYQADLEGFVGGREQIEGYGALDTRVFAKTEKRRFEQISETDLAMYRDKFLTWSDRESEQTLKKFIRIGNLDKAIPQMKGVVTSLHAYAEHLFDDLIQSVRAPDEQRPYFWVK
jgi:hypothetical protein